MRKGLLILAGIFFLISFIFLKHYLSIFYFQNDLNKIVLNIETPQNGELYVCFNQNCDLAKYKNGIYSYKLNQQNPLFYYGKTSEIELIGNKNLLSKIKYVDLFLGHKYEKIEINSKINEVDFLSKTNYSLTFFTDNNKTFIQKTGIYIESIFYNWYFYLVSYVLILIYLIKYQKRFNFKIKYPIFLILLLATVLRLSHIDFVPLWNDELYVLTYISNMGDGFNIQRTFLDPGNPPLFFILSNIWLKYFKNSIFQIRLLPLILGVFQVYFIYFVLKNILNKKIALIASFLSAINIFIIVESNEIRSYILAMSLVLAGLYSFYKLKNDFNYKNLFFYLIISILLINTHYYCILYVLANFILGMILFKDKMRFFAINIFAHATFLPYFLITFKQKSLEAGFNTWIEKPTLDVINNHIMFYFGNVLFFIIVVIFSIFVFKKLEKREKEIFSYSVFIISFVFISAYLISIFVKPILFERYFCIFLPLFIINTAIFLNVDFKVKFQPLIVILILLFSINIPKYENFNLFSNIDLLVNYFSNDYKIQNKNSYLIISDKIDYLKYYPQIPKDKVVISKYGIREDVDLLEYFKSQIPNKNNAILYLGEICINSKLKKANDVNIKKIETTIVPIYKIVLE